MGKALFNSSSLNLNNKLSSRKRWAWFSASFSICCLIGLVLFFGKENLNQVINQSQDLSLYQSSWLWAFLCSGLVFALRSLRLKLVLNHISLQDCLYICATHNALTRSLPFRSGELSLPFMLNKHHQVSFMEGSLLMLWLRLIEVASLLPFVAICLSFSPRLSKYLPYGQNELMFTIAVLSLCIVFWIRPLIQLSLRLAMLVFSSFNQESMLIKLMQINGLGQNLSSSKSSITLAITMLILFGQAGLFYWILDGCGASLSFLEVALASILVHLAGVIPAPTMGNVGTHEMAWTVIFKSFACSNPIAVLSALLSQWLTLFFAYLWWVLMKLSLYFSRS